MLKIPLAFEAGLAFGQCGRETWSPNWQANWIASPDELCGMHPSIRLGLSSGLWLFMGAGVPPSSRSTDTYRMRLYWLGFGFLSPSGLPPPLLIKAISFVFQPDPIRAIFKNLVLTTLGL